jgi:hypothetical protein
MTEETQVNETESVVTEETAVEETPVVTEEAAVASAAAPSGQIEITANDLATVVRIIDAGSQRGTFRGEELAAVGVLRNKFAAAVNALAPKEPEGEAAAEKTEASAA